MSIAAAQLCVAILGVVVLFQVALIGGAPWGQFTQGGQYDGALPLRGRLVALMSVGVLIWCGAAVLSAAGIGLDWPRWTGWVAVGTLTLSGIANLISPSEGERRLWGTLAMGAGALAFGVVLAG